MNNHVLVAMDRRNYTTKELENNVGFADNDEGFDSHAQAAFNVALAAYEGSIHFDLWRRPSPRDSNSVETDVARTNKVKQSSEDNKV